MARKKLDQTDRDLVIGRIKNKVYTEQEQRLLDQITVEILSAFEKDITEGKRHLKNIQECYQSLLKLKVNIDKVSEKALKIKDSFENSDKIYYEILGIKTQNEKNANNTIDEIRKFKKQNEEKISSLEKEIAIQNGRTTLSLDMQRKKFDKLEYKIITFSLVMIFLMAWILVKQF